MYMIVMHYFKSNLLNTLSSVGVMFLPVLVMKASGQ
jgi:hypothetical protein